MRTRIPLAAAGIAAASAGLLVGLAPTAGAAAGSPVVGHTYVNGNTPGVNTVAGFDRHLDGTLTPLAGSPFAIGGAGRGAGLGSQGALQATKDGRFLLAVDAGSNEISVLSVGQDGVPSPVGAPVPSGGVEPVSIAVSNGGLVYVANVGTGGSNLAGFRLAADGSLTPLPDAVYPVPEGSGTGDVLFNSTGDRLVATLDNPSLIAGYTVRPDGHLVEAAGSPFQAETLGPIGAEFRPTNPSQLYVTNAHAGPGAGTVSAFTVTRQGALSSIAGSPFASGQTATCWVDISQNGKYLYAVNTAARTLSSFDILADGSLRLAQTTPFNDGVGALDARLSPDGKYLSVTGGRGHKVSTFAVDGSTLTELPASPVDLPADSTPVGLVVL